MDVRRLRVGRFVRCPRCRASFQSMRMAHYACPECGHQWQVESHRGRIERLRDHAGDVGGGALFASLWALTLAMLVGALALLYLLLSRIADAWGIVGVIVAVVIIGLAIGYRTVSGSDRAWGWWSRQPADHYLQDDRDRTRKRL